MNSKISTDPGLLKIRHSHRFVAVVIQILIPIFIVPVIAGQLNQREKEKNDFDNIVMGYWYIFMNEDYDSVS